MTEIVKKDLLYKGKAKEMYTTNEPNTMWVHYMDQVTAFNGKKKVQMEGKGQTNCEISSLIFKDLANHGIKNHFIKQIDSNNQLVKRVKIIPLETVVRNFASGSFEKKFAVKHLMKFDKPVQEFFFKSDELDDPFINDFQAEALNVATENQMNKMRAIALKVNDRLKEIFSEMNIDLVDFKVEFGIDSDNELILADEISPDSCRLIDRDTKKSLDKDVFRKGLGALVPVYKEILGRLEKVEDVK
ncbi:phosphoribosylaminoimidazolesuccinocarboxamide synthase [Lentilactobacillus kefiri]|uniref:Phosphoribosylaminoimidazole-succinocarboxamide synthase n=3 Tax=Bacilli TaxID=91061 RepID=A0A8E1RJ71_LENKE|nr:phosphoribosylaminoimidazolesuccinocarboxamide synthase [Lentilactobacillus kefiri]KRL72701.1 phosphoribosylaminoimidazole-succinocarboxamide synthase [Lentilactobacillus parakefiri DSM 10551]KRM52688.1 phosphoribosylaminoimidazole-succinocarboxamide synthase [Lentilactobacillus kefiri DSM 20587 = JCM 5818]MCJ2161400.1 phosphoribosylaminoimidazolesuccinocarboxamide synthase [Lentilactobacillus kefiri]MCP9368676.1 phosphoribosylaminoimidazolesuccinocarboxamide synthase [Lentilactobacillus kef